MAFEGKCSGKPLLVFGYGNLSRGDDALGPLLIDRIERHTASMLANIDVLCDFQLQIEHALDLEDRDLVLFVDASVADIDGFGFSELSAARDDSYSTHAMSPSAVMSVYQSIMKKTPPPCFLLSIKGERFELGEGLSVNAQHNLSGACRFVERLLLKPDYPIWKNMAEAKPIAQDLA